MDKNRLIRFSILLLLFSEAACRSAMAENQAEAEQKAQQQRAQQERGQQEQLQRAQQERGQQEQLQRAQQEQQRQMQQQQQRAQQEEQRQMQEQQQRAQQAQQRQMQEQQQRAQQEQQRQVQEQQQRAQQEQQRQIQEQQRVQQETAQRSQQLREQESQREQQQHQAQMQAEQVRDADHHLQQRPASLPPQAAPIGHEPNAAAFAAKRSGAPPVLNTRGLSFKTAAPPPVVATNANEQQKQRALIAGQNMRTHLVPVLPGQAPKNFQNIRREQLGAYANNYPLNFNNRQFFINRQNTYVNPISPNYYPSWYNSQPGWQYCNGFTFGPGVMSGVDWLRSGWEPYWGQAPEGFVCSDDYMPTPWVYFPAMNAWRQPGSMDYVDNGPPLDYTGPITVAVLEPMRVMVSDPQGFPHREFVNQLYFYDAYFYPDNDRWGYTNDRGYFIWLNV